MLSKMSYMTSPLLGKLHDQFKKGPGPLGLLQLGNKVIKVLGIWYCSEMLRWKSYRMQVQIPLFTVFTLPLE